MKALTIDRAILWICRYNRANPPIEITKKTKFAGFEIVFNWRSSKNLWGRFGGGWNWKLGVMIGGTTVILDILIFSIRINKARQENKESQS